MKAERSRYAEEIDAILQECAREVEEAIRRYETDLDSALSDLRDQLGAETKTIH